jgi:RHS repeat-associated protein
MRRTSDWRWLRAVVVGVVAAASLPMSAQAQSGPAPFDPAVPAQMQPVGGRPYTPPAPPPDPEAEAAPPGPAKAAWPAPGAATITVPARAQARPASAAAVAGSLPVRVAPAGTGTAAGTRVRVDVHDRAAATRAGADGPLLSVRRADGGTGTTTVALTVDYSAFRDIYGGDWASRLRLVPQGEAAPIGAVRNDGSTLTAEVAVDAAGGTFAIAAEEEGEAGDYKATSLSPSGSWQVGVQSGAFSWSYPMAPPPVPGGLVPEVVAAYSSNAVDGRTVARNNQPSWLGEGWDLSAGFIEREYKPCAKDLGGNNGSTKTGDLCWETHNATMAFGEHSSRLVFSGGVWRPETDDGVKVERLTGAVNGDGGEDSDRGEYWQVTTTDGTKYFFGLNRLPNWAEGKATTQSTWTVPVFGNDASEPCHKAAFAASACDQAYRWNLDYVVDPHGNSMAYHYTPEVNKYGRNMATATASYVRGGTLNHIDYGTRTGSEYAGPAPARVTFATADRCAPNRDCAVHDGRSWPDVPWDMLCSTATCPGKFSPTFFTTKRLASVTTHVSKGAGAYDNVDRWDFAHTFPPVDALGGAGLWLNSITRTGLAGGSLPLPSVSFDATMLPNRLNTLTDGLSSLTKPRILKINTETGSAINVNYLGTDCVASAPPGPATNTRRCYPVRWTPPSEFDPRDDWFIKYVVSSVREDDTVTDNEDVVTRYTYAGGGAWAYDDNPIVPPDVRTWSVWRGFEHVTVTEGEPANDEGRGTSKRTYLFFRGMHGDRTAAGGTKTVNVTSSDGVVLADRKPLAGFRREESAYDGATLVQAALYQPWIEHRATAGHLSSNQVETIETRSRERLATGAYRTTRVHVEYDDYGNETKINDLGDLDRTGDERCTTATYRYNTTAHLVDLASETVTVGVACGVAASYPADAIAHTRLSYDGAAYGTPPTKGNVTATQVARSYSGSTPSFLTTETSTYDQYGQELTSTDALQRRTTTAYAVANGLAIGTTVTNPIGQQTLTTIAPARGLATRIVAPGNQATVFAYDALGRQTSVYLPGRNAEAGHTPNLRFAYQVRKSGGPSWVRTDKLTARDTHQSTYALLDGMLRTRQTQAPSGTGSGRVVADTYHDARGLVSAVTKPYYEEGAPGTTLLQGPAGSLPAHTVTLYDGLERPTAEIFIERNQVERWRTVTSYGGDHVTVIPPAGGTVTTTYNDARGRVISRRQWHGRTTTAQDTYDETRYGYTKRDELASVTDAAGNAWTYDYDVLGNKVRATDPDAGVTTMRYDDAGQMTASTDGRGKTVVMVYDGLGRKIQTRLGSATGTLLTTSAYDTLLPGKLTSSTRFADGKAYTTAITGYNAAGRPLGQAVTVPDVGGAEGDLAGTYTTTMTYKADGSLASKTLPALAPGVPSETLVYEYETTGLLDTVTGSQPYVVDTTYTALGEVTHVMMGTTGKRLVRKTHFEEGTRRVVETRTAREAPGEGILVNDLQYQYDPMGNVTSIEDRTAGAALDNQCLRYDHLRRVTAAWTQATDGCTATPSASAVGGPAPYWQEFTYDRTGNRTRHTVKGLGGAADVVRNYTYPASGAGAVRPHAVTSVSGVGSFTYDASGNTLGRPGPAGAQTLRWTDDGLPESITTGGRTTSYTYAGDGTQLIRRDPGTVTLFVGDGEIRLDSVTRAMTGTRYHADLGTRTAAGFTWTVSDHHGTSTVAVDSNTMATTVRRTDLFGNLRGGPVAWPAGNLGFVGGTSNAETGLTRLGAREYDPALGRFISVDPIIDPNDPQQLNGYAYANNSPATMTDPDGQKYFIDDSGYSQDARARPKRWPKKTAYPRQYPSWAQPGSRRGWRPSVYAPPRAYTGPVKRARSIAHLRDFGASCRHDRRHCDSAADRARNDNRTKHRDFGARCQDTPKTCRTVRRIAEAMAAAKQHGIDLTREQAAKAFSQINERADWSVSFCNEVSGGALIGGSFQTCTNIDNIGITYSESTDLGLHGGVSIFAGVAIRVQNQSASEVQSTRDMQVSAGPSAGLGPHGAIEANASVMNGREGGLSLKLGVGAGASVGSLLLSTHAYNSGY